MLAFWLNTFNAGVLLGCALIRAAGRRVPGTPLAWVRFLRITQVLVGPRCLTLWEIERAVLRAHSAHYKNWAISFLGFLAGGNTSKAGKTADERYALPRADPLLNFGLTLPIASGFT